MPNPWLDPVMRDAMRIGVCTGPTCSSTTYRPWTPLIIPPRITSAVLEIMCEALVLLDMDYLKEHPNTPPIFSSGIRYKPELPGQEQWLTIPYILMRGHGDCEDLAAWRVAELRLRGGDRKAKCINTATVDPRDPSKKIYHIRVQRGNRRDNRGRPLIEDPSATLGMTVTGASPEIYTEKQTLQNPHASGSYFETFITDGDKL